MKKFLVMIVVALATISANAQIYVGGELGVWRDTDADQTAFTLAPGAGYEFNEKWAAGGELLFSTVTDDYTKFAIAPYARWTFFNSDRVKLFLDMGFGISVTNFDNKVFVDVEESGDGDITIEADDDVTGFRIGVQPGIAFKLNKHFSVLAKVGFLGYDNEYEKAGREGFGMKLNGENLSFGIEYTF